jgi:hypothetical protein
MQNQKYVKLPPDLFKIKEKIIGGLSKRQLIGFAIGAAMGAIPFFVVKSIAGTLAGVLALCIFAAPAVFCGIFEKNGVGAQRYIKMVVNYYRTPRRRFYRSRPAIELVTLILEKQDLERRLRLCQSPEQKSQKKKSK